MELHFPDAIHRTVYWNTFNAILVYSMVIAARLQGITEKDHISLISEQILLDRPNGESLINTFTGYINAGSSTDANLEIWQKLI
jgi:hypothetical protein